MTLDNALVAKTPTDIKADGVWFVSESLEALYPVHQHDVEPSIVEAPGPDMPDLVDEDAKNWIPKPVFHTLGYVPDARKRRWIYHGLSQEQPGGLPACRRVHRNSPTNADDARLGDHS